MHFNIDHVRKTDPEIAKALDNELDRQQTHLEMIASENFASRAVLEAAGSVMTNKYAEGYPGRRYYGGCAEVDVAESLAIERAKALFGAEHANVQPHSGAQANIAAYLAFIKPGDTVVGLNLSHGGHLTHGSPVNISGMYFHFIPYGVRKDTEVIDYDEVRSICMANKPKLIVTGATAYPRQIHFSRFREIADECGAFLMADIAHIAGLVVADLHPSSVPHAHVTTSTTHKTLRGPRAGFILTKAEYAKQVDKAVFPGMQGGPLMHVIAAKAVAFKEAGTPEFRKYQEQIIKNAKALSLELVSGGLRLVSGGTDNHLVLVDLRGLKLTGKIAEQALDEVNITVNKNTIPYDPESAFITSGVRIGVPAITTRGMVESDMKLIGSMICEVLKNAGNASVKAKVKDKVLQLCGKYPLYKD